MTAAAARLSNDDTAPTPALVPSAGRACVAVQPALTPGAEVADAELVRRAARGDERAFETLYFRHRDWVMHLALRFTADRDLALDVTQETFAYLVRRLPTLNLTARLTTFLYPAVKHLSQSARRKGRRASGGGDALQTMPATPEAVLDDAGLVAAISTLPADQQEVILLRYAHGLMPTEIAAALGIPVGTAKSRLFAATGALGERLTAHP